MSMLLFILAMLSNPPPRVILITIDGTRTNEIFYGSDPHRGPVIPPEKLVPNLYHYFVDRGVVIGKTSDMVASGTNHVSLPGYLEILRGHPSWDCNSNDCNPIIDRSIVQLFEHPAVFSSWIGIAKTLPANYSGYSDIGTPYYRWDADTEVAVRKYICNFQPGFLWVSLGDPDEFAHRSNYNEYLNSIHNADAFIGELVSNDDGNTTFVITTDHGRSKDFTTHGKDIESSKVWLALYGKGIPALGFVREETTVSLSEIYDLIFYLHLGLKSKLF